MKRDTIFFDLDGTLLPLDMENFFRQFKQLLKDAEIKAPSGKQISGVLLRRAIQFTLSPKHPTRTNEEAFFDFFEKKAGITRDYLEPLFDRFYNEKFDILIGHSHIEPLAREVVAVLKAKGYRLVLATNPVFPKIATLKRLEWADIDKDDFVYMTTYDNSRFSKPHLKYYEEILEKLFLKAEQCIMVGNNVKEDLCALHLGFDVFLLTDYIIGDVRKAPECKKGNYSDLKDWAESLPPV